MGDRFTRSVQYWEPSQHLWQQLNETQRPVCHHPRQNRGEFEGGITSAAKPPCLYPEAVLAASLLRLSTSPAPKIIEKHSQNGKPKKINPKTLSYFPHPKMWLLKHHTSHAKHHIYTTKTPHQKHPFFSKPQQNTQTHTYKKTLPLWAFRCTQKGLRGARCMWRDYQKVLATICGGPASPSMRSVLIRTSMFL